jgi:hypothetical protein
VKLSQLSSDPNVRMQELLYQSEDLRQNEQDWRRDPVPHPEYPRSVEAMLPIIMPPPTIGPLIMPPLTIGPASDGPLIMPPLTIGPPSDPLELVPPMVPMMPAPTPPMIETPPATSNTEIDPNTRMQQLIDKSKDEQQKDSMRRFFFPRQEPPTHLGPERINGGIVRSLPKQTDVKPIALLP